ncbi:MAG: FAD-binding oxidoreductase, partial [Pandoraea sp.]|nr:FAD-binding oxidoreductase [Pandoraea sp.]
MNDSSFLTACRDLLGRDHVLLEAADTDAYLTDQRKRYTGRALAVLRPADAAQVAALVRLCVRHGGPMVPQGVEMV